MATGNTEQDFEVKRTADNKVEVTLPKGMKFTAENLTIEDLIEAANKHGVIKSGAVSQDGDSIVLRCCSGNTAIA